MKKLLTLLSLFAYLGTHGQYQQNIRGTVIDQDSKSPLAFANVVVTTVEPIVGGVTDFDGRFKIEDIPVGRHTIKISFVGYEPKTLQNMEVTSGKELIIDIALQESVMMKEVVIEAENKKEKSINEMATVSARTFSIEETQRYAGSLNDVSRMAQNFAGVQGADDSRNDIVIRGNSPTGVLFRLEGVDIPNPNHFALMGTTGGPVSVLNNNILDNSDFMTGAFPAEYGNALAGVFDLNLRNGNNQEYEFLGQIGFNGLEFMAEGPINKEKYSSFLVNGRYSTLKLFHMIGLDFGTGTATPDYQDLSFKLNFPNKKGSIVLWGLGGLSSIAFLESEQDIGDNLFTEGGEDMIFNSKIGAIGLSNTYRFNEKAYLKTVVSMDAVQNNIQNDSLNVFEQTYFPFYRNNSVEGKQTFKTSYHYKLNSKHLFSIGANNQRRFFNLNDSIHIKTDSIILPTNDYFVVDPHWRQITDYEGAAFLIQPYLQWQYRINNRITLNTGLHGQYFTYNGAFALEPRLGLKYNLNENNTFSVAYGMHHQLPPSRLYFKQLEDEFGQPILGANGQAFIPNKNLGMTRSQHFIAAYDRSLGKHTRLKTEAYYQHLDRVPISNTYGAYSILNYGANFELAFPDTLVNEGTAYNYGIELTLEHFLHKGFYYLFTASLYESKYTGSDGALRNTAFNGNYTVNLLLGKEFRFKSKKETKKTESSLVFDLKLTMNGGQRYIPVNLEESQLAGRAVYDYENAFEPQLKDYFRTDLKIGYKKNQKKITQEWALNFQNLTNHQNVFYRAYDEQSGTEKTFYQNSFLPIIQYRILF